MAAQHGAHMQEIRKTLIKTPDMAPEIKNILKVQANLDEYMVENWKQNTIENLIQAYPLKHRRNIGYNDWDSAMNYLTAVRVSTDMKKKQ